MAQAMEAFVPDKPLYSILSPEGQAIESELPPLDAATLKRFYRLMLINRLVDERMTMLQRQGRIGFYIGAQGEEAAIIGSAAALQDEDWIFPAYREFGAALVRGFPLRTLVCNLYGNAEDPILGRQMPNHYSDIQRKLVSISSPVGTQIPQCTGVAWALQLQKRRAVSLVYFGDGTTSQGDFHVGVNFAGVYNVPAIFLIRNNQWAISVPLERQCAAETLVSKAAGYGIEGVRVDGNDLLAVYKVTREAAMRAREGGGPTLIEAVTYRQGAHSTSDDPKAYRAQEEVDTWMAKDPILRFRRFLEGKGLWDEKQETEVRAALDEEIRQTIREVEGIDPPDIDSLFNDVYEEMPWHLREQYEELMAVRAEARERS